MRHFRTFLLFGALVLPRAPRAQTPAPAEAAAAADTVFGDEELASYFASGPLKQAAAELQAGNAARVLKLVHAKAQEFPERWLRAQALRTAGRGGAARAALEPEIVITSRIRPVVLICIERPVVLTLGQGWRFPRPPNVSGYSIRDWL